MSTLSHTMKKEDVFAKYRTIFTEHYAQNNAFEEQKQQISAQIQGQMQAFSAVLSQNQTDPARTKFFEQLHQAITIQEQLAAMTVQGNTFYLQLNDALIKLQQSINDYKMSRDL